jgi:hypothetical protein
MEPYCRRENIFFTEQDKVSHQIEFSKSRYRNFRSTFEKAFSHLTDIPDHPDHFKLLSEEPSSSQNIGDELLIDSHRRPVLVYQRPKTIVPSLGSTKRDLKEYELKNQRKIANEFEKIKNMLESNTN